MGWLEDELARGKGAQQAATAASPGGVYAPNPLEGFIGSAASGFGEMFGQDPTDAAAQYRAENPVAGMVSQIAPMLVPYIGTEMAAAKIPQFAAAVTKGTEWASKGFGLAKAGITAIDNRVAYGAVREMVKFAPVELSRLGIGLATAPEENYGDLLADVGLSSMIAGAGGAIGGFFRAGGKLQQQVGRVKNAEFGLAPTFELRMADTPGATFAGDMLADDVKAQLRLRVLTETPTMNVPKGASSRYVTALEGGTPETDSMIDVMFRADASKGTRTGLDRRLLTESPESNYKALDPGKQQEVLGGLGFEDLNDLASTVRYPRHVTVRSDRAAGTLAKALDDSTGMQMIADGVLLGRQADDGLWVVGKRLKAGEAPTGPTRRFGDMKLAEGDEWFFGLTDKPQRFLPAEHKVSSATVSTWAKMREAFHPGQRDDFFNRGMDEALTAMTPKDPELMQKLGRKAWTEQFAGKLAKASDYKMGMLEGVAGSAQAKAIADTFYNWFQPTLFQEFRNPAYGRLLGLLRGTQLMANSRVNQIIKGNEKFSGSPIGAIFGRGISLESGFKGHEPASQLWGKLFEHSKDEFQLVVRAGIAKMPAESLAKLSASGEISPFAVRTYEALQNINKSVWEEVAPVFRGTELEGKFNLLDGYFIPRIFKGDWFTQVVDEAGRPAWLATGRSASAAQAEADAIIEAGTSLGKKLSISKDYLKGSKEFAELDSVSALHQMVDDSLGRGADMQAVVEKALRKLNGQRISAGGVGAPKQLTTKRTGALGSPDLREYTLDDVVRQTQQHYSNIYSYAGEYSWRKRWGQEGLQLAKLDPVMSKDLFRKAEQYLGKAGEITQVLDKTLAPVLGRILGGRPATKIAQATNELMYNWNLAIFNPTFALLNALTPLQMLPASISYIKGAPAAEIARMYQFTPELDAAGKFVGVAGHLSIPKVMGAAVQGMRNPSPELKGFLERALTDGTLQHSQVNEWLGASSAAATTLRDTYKNHGVWEGIKRTSTYMAEKSEQFSRMMSATAMYDIGKHHFKLEGDNLYRFMQKGVQVVNYGYSTVDRSRAFTGPLGSMFGLFKNWQFHFINQMAVYSGSALRGEAFGPLLWQGGAALALGGLGATPLRGIADGLAKWHSDSPSSFQWLQEHWGDGAEEGSSVGDAVYFGLPSLLGVSLQASSSLPGTDVRNEVANLGNMVILERAKAVTKAVGDAMAYGDATGTNALRDPNIRDKLIQAIAPRAVFKMMSVMEGDYMKSMSTGQPSVRGIGPSTLMMQGLGLNQVEVERQQVATRELYKDQQASRAIVQNLGMMYADAMERQDSSTMRYVINQAMLQSVDISSVMKSVASRGVREAGDGFNRFDKDKVLRHTQALGIER